MYEVCRPLAVADDGTIREALRFSQLPLQVRAVTSSAEGKYEFGTIDVLNLLNVDLAKLQYGKVSAMCGAAAFQYVTKIIKLALAKQIDATVTGPLNKEAIQLADNALKRIGVPQRRIAVCGLNPHCGEAGLFGTEDAEEIAPAIAEARAQGINADGPIAADTVFSKMKGGQYDIVVCMYHDQGHIPTKLTGFRYDDKTKT